MKKPVVKGSARYVAPDCDFAPVWANSMFLELSGGLESLEEDLTEYSWDA